MSTTPTTPLKSVMVEGSFFGPGSQIANGPRCGGIGFGDAVVLASARAATGGRRPAPSAAPAIAAVLPMNRRLESAARCQKCEWPYLRLPKLRTSTARRSTSVNCISSPHGGSTRQTPDGLIPLYATTCEVQSSRKSHLAAEADCEMGAGKMRFRVSPATQL